MKHVFKTIAVTGVLIGSGNAFALVGVEAGVGQRSSKVVYDTPVATGKSKTIKGNEYFANVLFDPIPVVPVAFGLAVQVHSDDRSDVDKDIIDDTITAAGGQSALWTKTASAIHAGTYYGPMIKVWAPIPFVKPYLKYAYLMGKEVTTVDYDIHTTSNSTLIGTSVKGTETSDHTGADLDIGIGYTPIKLINIFLEYSIHSGKSKVVDQSIEETTVAGTTSTVKSYDKSSLTDDQKKSQNANATSIRFGIEVGI